MQKQLLTDVVVIRPILIVLLVFYHAFAIYGGSWKPIDGYPSIRLYWWMDWLSYSFMLETFVFISGYVFGFQVRRKGKKILEFQTLLCKKFKRLIIPSMIFSFTYIVLFQDISTINLYKLVYELFKGVGHLWFLPMLFWCFMGVWTIERLSLSAKRIIPVLLVMSLLSFHSIPFQLNYSFYYMPFFYIGYLIQKNNVNFNQYYNRKSGSILCIFFIMSFIITSLLIESVADKPTHVGGGIV